MTPILITWTALCDGGACEDGIREHFPALRAAGVVIPEDETTISVDLLTLVQVLGVDVALSGAAYAGVDDQRLRLFAADCAERVLLWERDAGRETDPRPWATVEVVRRYARGEATAGELAAASAAAWAAARAARAAAWTANEAAAWAANEAAATEREWQTQRLTYYLTTETA